MEQSFQVGAIHQEAGCCDTEETKAEPPDGWRRMSPHDSLLCGSLGVRSRSDPAHDHTTQDGGAGGHPVEGIRTWGTRCVDLWIGVSGFPGM